MVLESRNHHERKTNETSKFLSTAFSFSQLVRFLTVSNTFTSLVHDILNKRIFPVCYWCKLFKWVISMLPQASILSEAKCKAIDIKCICYFHANETHFLKKGFAVGLVSKVSLSNSEMAYSLDIFLQLKIWNVIYSFRIHVVIYDDGKFFHELFLLTLFYVAKKSQPSWLKYREERQSSWCR